MDETLRARFERKYALWKQRLLDITAGNRLVNFRPTKVATVGIVSPSVSELFQKLVLSEKPLRFPLFEGSIVLSVNDEGDEEAPAPRFKVRPGDIETSKSPPDLERSLYRLSALSRVSKEERGVNTLYLCLGMLEWRPADHAETQRAPLVLVPVDLGREDRLKPYVLSPFDEDPEVNRTLIYMLKEDFGFALPEFPDEPSINDLADFFQRVSRAVSPKGWRVHPEAWLGQFHFKKLAMHKDLEDHGAVAHENPRLVGVAGMGAFDGGTPIGSEETFDEIRPSEVFTVLDADSSQLAALLRARAGQDIVIEGPPGTGKSQTITNLIAQSLLDGKKVLFVSEKRAALEVVHRRLRDVGIGPFCLEIHSDKANKRDVIQRIGASLQARRPGGGRKARGQFEMLLSFRRDLNEYVRALHRPELFEKSAFDLHAELAQLESVPTIEAKVEFSIAALDQESELRLMRQARKLTQMPQMVIGYREHPWFGCTLAEWSLEQQELLRSQLQRFRESIASFDPVAARVSEAMGSPRASSLAGVDAFVELATVFAASPCPPRAWLEDAPLDEIRESAKLLALRQDTHTRLKQALLSHYAARLFDVDCSALDRALNPGVPHVLAAMKDQAAAHSVLAVAGSRIGEGVRQALNAVAALTTASKSLAASLGETAPADLGSTTRLARLAAFAADDPRPIEAWFSWQEVSRLLDEARSASRKRTRAAAVRAKLGEEFSDQFLDLPVEQWLSDFKERYAGFSRIFNREYRARMRSIRGLLRTDRRVQYARVLQSLTLGAEWAKIEEWFATRSAEHTRTMGIHFKGIDTDWEGLGSRLKTLRSILEVYQGDPVPSAFTAALVAGESVLREIRDLGVEIETQRGRFLAALNSLSEYLQIESLLGVSEFEGIALSALHDRLGAVSEQVDRFLSSLQILDDVSRPGTSRGALEKAADARQASDVIALEREFAVAQESLFRTYGHLFSGINTQWNDVILGLDWAARFREVRGRSPLDDATAEAAVTPQRVEVVRADLGTLKSLAEELRGGRAVLARVFNVESIRPASASVDDAALDALCSWLDVRISQIGSLSDWILFQALRRECAQSGLADFVTKALERHLPPEDLERALAKRLRILQLDEIYRRVPRLRAFQWRDHEDLIARFKSLDRELMAAHAEIVRSGIVERQPSLNGPAVGQVGLLRRELAKQRRHVPLRKLFEQSGNVILGCTPCLLMSPLSVATYLPKDSVLFDLVIFDEASQMPAEDSAGAVLRGKQLLVAGDSKQLPPTRFFQRALDEEGDYEDDDEILESVLDDCRAASMQRCSLDWHYRSRHESLVSFSNAEFYNNSLVTFPSPTALALVDCGVRLEFVADGVYDRGKSRTNREEARRVARLVERHLDRWRDRRSLGVITFSSAQEQAVNEEIERLADRRHDLEGLLRRSGGEAFFVKPLETVQGDERDSIIITVGYGKDSTGVLALNFGPVNLEGGERRLNVAFTRARWELVLVTSIHPEDIDEARVQKSGPKVLKRYLSFAKDGRLPPETAAPRGEFESPFEMAVWEALREKEYEVDRQVGVSRYRIDLAVRDPMHPGRYLLGIECDGATYHSAAVARDRDRLRQQVLERLGWKLHRIWSTDWIRDRSGALQRLLAHIEELKQANPEVGEEDPEPPSASTGELLPEPEDNPDHQGLAIEPAADPYAEHPGIGTFEEPSSRRHRRREEFYDGDDSDVREDVVHAVTQEGPIHEDLLIVRVARMYELSRTGATVNEIITSQIRHATRQRTIQRRGVFLWPSSRERVNASVP